MIFQSRDSRYFATQRRGIPPAGIYTIRMLHLVPCKHVKKYNLAQPCATRETAFASGMHGAERSLQLHQHHEVSYHGSQYRGEEIQGHREEFCSRY